MTQIRWKLTDESGDNLPVHVRGEPCSFDPGALSDEEGKVWDLLIFGPEIPEPGEAEDASFEDAPSEANR